MHACSVAKSYPTLCDPMDWTCVLPMEPNRLLHPWNFPGKKYWSGLPLPPPGDFPNLNPHLLLLLNWQADSWSLGHLGNLYNFTKMRKTLWRIMEPILIWRAPRIIFEIGYFSDWSIVSLHFPPCAETGLHPSRFYGRSMCPFVALPSWLGGSILSQAWRHCSLELPSSPPASRISPVGASMLWPTLSLHRCLIAFC